MKQGIHPDNYRPVVFKDMSNGDMFLSRSTAKTNDTVEFEGETYPVVKLEISSSSHPFYTGKSKVHEPLRSQPQVITATHQNKSRGLLIRGALSCFARLSEAETVSNTQAPFVVRQTQLLGSAVDGIISNKRQTRKVILVELIQNCHALCEDKLGE